MPEQTKISKKVCMLGTFGVGKSSLVRQFVYQKFDESYLSTIGVQLSHKAVGPLLDKKTNRPILMNLILWDLAHLERFDPVVRNYFHGSHGAVIVFDLTRPQTFREYENLIKPFFETNPESKLILVGNKTDLSFDDNPRTQIADIAANLSCSCHFTSAKTGENVELVFQTIAEMIL